ncbi:hypothetical protein [Tenggerimyces flavus]|uniref:Uncharacterized protein n=1 Tax=Tenggerimyces flavus TaxID=1708749 RepID=A0ABV7Y7X1_9ACTN|nr:hypothetical protein [Tenggerimyces flavus]MBM7785184.1 hypothetical protein [Tenggerimyces flavus]
MAQVTTPIPPPAGRAPAAPGLRRVRILVALVILLELVALVVAIGLTGGFRAAQAQSLPRAEPGEPVANGRFEFRVLRAWTETKDPTSNPSYAKEGSFLVLEMDLRLTVKESLQFGADIQESLRLRLSNGYVMDGDSSKSHDQRSGVVLASDRSPVSLQPGLPERVLAVYELPASQPFPSQLDVVIYRQEYEPGFFSRQRTWRTALDDPELALVHLPVARGAG